MRLALLTPEWYEDEGGGIATYCRTFAAQAASQGHDVTVLAATEHEHVSEHFGSGIELVPIITQRGISILDRATVFRDTWRSLGRHFDAIEAAEFGGVAALIASEAPVITRLHTPLALLLERNGGSPIYGDDAQRCALEAFQVRESVLVTSPTNWLEREAKRLWNVAARVIPNPVTRSSIPPPPRAAAQPLRVLYLGRIEHRKGVLTLAEATRPLIEMAQIELTLVGGDTKWLGSSMRGRVEHSLAPHSARMLEPRHGEALVTLIDEADLIVLPSLFENFAYACVESMGRAKCVIGTGGSGFDEIIEHEHTGILVPPNNALGLRDAIAACADGAHDLAGIGWAAWSSLSRFDAATIVHGLSNVYLDATRSCVLES